MRLQLLAKVILAILGTTPVIAFAINEPTTNNAVHTIVSVGVGNPPTMYDLILDTGSANTWIGAKNPYVVTPTSHRTGQTVSVSGGTSKFSGAEYLDQVTLGDLVLFNQSIGVAQSTTGFDGVDGVLGLGPVGLSRGTLSPDTNATVPTVTDNAYSQGSIPANEIGLSFQPATSASEQSGELTWGGADNTKFTGEITWAKITTVHPANEYWGLDASFSYGSGTSILSKTAGIVDAGTTLLLLATNAFQSYQKATGGVPDSATGLLRITTAQYDALQPLNILVNDVTFALTPNAQIWPRSLNTNIGGDANAIYLIVADINKSPGETGLDFILGHSVLERFYAVLDTANNRIGLATTPFTDKTTN